MEHFVNYRLLTINGKRHGQLRETLTFQTPVLGFDVILPDNPCRLYTDGTLEAGAGFVWDFGTFAIDTPDLVIASIPHDIFCRLTNQGLLPWYVRSVADTYLRTMLEACGASWFSRWRRWLGVRANSKFNAYWRRVK